MFFRRHYFVPFAIGAILYPIIELIYRGRTHYSMMILGGMCFFAVYTVNRLLPTRYFLQKLLCSVLIITELEFIVGCIVNISFGLGVWDYSSLPLNILGQVCPRFSFYWLILAFSVIPFDELLLYYYKEK